MDKIKLKPNIERRVSIGATQIWLDKDKKFKMKVPLMALAPSTSKYSGGFSIEDPPNDRIIAYMAIAYPVTFVKWLETRDCNCFECSEKGSPGSQDPCDNNCSRNMLKFLQEKYDYNRDIFEINETAWEDLE